MDQSFINKLTALIITSLVVVIGLVLLKTADLPEVTYPYSEGQGVTVYDNLN
ncbi:MULTISPECIES: hypothetical protein [unclassified Saccharicrinis]|uniref:hypothetical protein n=1 Tax=unclassified Saccharicrinis TaxID=2646859 RepID=UPI003D32D067